MKQIFCLFLLLYTLAPQILARPSDVNTEDGSAVYSNRSANDNDTTVLEILTESSEVITEDGSGVYSNKSANDDDTTVLEILTESSEVITEDGSGVYSNKSANDDDTTVLEILTESSEVNGKGNSTKGIHPNRTTTEETGRVMHPNVQKLEATTIHSSNSVQNTTVQAELEFSQRLLQQLRAHPYYPSGLSCSTCIIFLDIVREFWTKPGITRVLAIHFSISACVSLRIQHSDVCSGIIRHFEKEFYYIFVNGRLSSDGICSALMSKRCGDENLLNKPWNVTLPDTRKPTIEEPSRIKPGSPVIKVLHLTDLHIDLHYKESTSSVCGKPLCCRENNGPGDSGYWGSYGCDIPLRTLENALQHIKQHNNDISYIIMTGDIPPHDVWLETKSSQIEVMQRAFETIQEYFPEKKVFVAVGNHDTYPTNSFPPPSVSEEFSVQWLLDSYADMWSAWLPNTSLHTVRKGGYFTTLVSPGFRIVSINNNYCNKLNWWLLLNNTDPVGELQWLIQVLQSAEDKGEKVHIIAHIPPGINLCYKQWSWNYYKIINRYENTVTAQFCGHTHQDHFEIFYDLKDHSRPTSVMYVAPSLTTNTAYQPAYRIYEIEGEYEHSSRRILDHKTYELNLEKSNRDRKAYWELEYSAKDAYNMTRLQPADWNNLVARMENSDNLFQKFYKFKYRNPKLGSCDNDCKSREICALKSARSHDSTFCETTADHVIV